VGETGCMQLTETDVVLVTGGASGLGAATVADGLAAGARVVIIDLPEAIARLEPDERVVGVPADVRDEDQVQAAVDRAQEVGALRVVVNCAGIATPGRIIGKQGVLALEDFRRVVDINLVGTFNVLRLAAAAMLDNEPLDGDRGLIVMTASVAAYDGQIGQAAYAASKGGIAALTISAARDLADKLIRVMTIAPGVMETPMMAGLPEKARTTLEALVPHPARLGRPSEYAQLVGQLIANPLLNGEVIRLDGALRMPPR
jgi:NAD(P)-dependent dehydrogenase (short-subunit alcohol dehydrogenase family)